MNSINITGDMIVDDFGENMKNGSSKDKYYQIQQKEKLLRRSI